MEELTKTATPDAAADRAPFRFQAGSIDISAEIARADFERWIAPELGQIEGALQKVLDDAGLTAAAIDQVFLTGGSSFVPAVRSIFERRFGEAKLDGGAELTSIASGLALIGRERDLGQWTSRAG